MAIFVRHALGLDLGSHTIKAVEVRQTLRGLEMGAVHSMPALDPGDPRSRDERLRDFLRTHALPTDHVICAVPGDRITGRRLSFPFRDHKRLAQAVPLAVEDEIPLDPETLIVDWEQVGGDRSQAEVYAAAAPQVEVARLLDRLEEVEVRPRVVEAEGLVLGNLSTFFELAGARVLVDLGHRKTVLCLCIEGEPVATRTLPRGAGTLGEALARARGLDPGAASRALAEEGIDALGSGPPAAALDRLARELVRTLGAFEPVLTAFGLARVEELTLMGGGAHLHGIEGYLESRVGVPARRLAPPPTEAGKAFLAAGDAAVFGPAAALALRGTLRARTRTNFRQEKLALRLDVARIGRELAWTGVLAGVALVLAAGLLATSIVLQSRRAEELNAQVAALYREAFPGRPVPSNPVSAMRGAVDSAHDRADFLGVYRGNLSALDLLTEISARVPDSLEVVFEELAIEGQVVRIRGHSQSFEGVDRLRRELASFTPFSQIQVSEITTGREGAKSFSMTISMAAPERSATSRRTAPPDGRSRG